MQVGAAHATGRPHRMFIFYVLGNTPPEVFFAALILGSLDKY
jgi:hypothetical protein